jgi:universal stress protein E
MSKLLIVAGLEGQCAATSRGMQLAELMDLQVEVVAFAYANLKRLKLDRKGIADVKQRLLDQRRGDVVAQLNRVAGVGHGVKVNVIWSEDIHPWIIKRAAGDYAAVIKTRHRSESLGYTSTDWHLLRECVAPVLLVSRQKWKKGSAIMATVDLEATAKAKQALNVDVITSARHYAEMLQVDLSVLCVIDVPTLLVDLDLIDAKTYAKERIKELQPALAALAKKTGLPLSKFQLKRGPVAKTIVSEAAELKAQLVVMGTVGRRGVRAQVLGNTAEEALQLLKTDTLTLKP